MGSVPFFSGMWHFKCSYHLTCTLHVMNALVLMVNANFCVFKCLFRNQNFFWSLLNTLRNVITVHKSSSFAVTAKQWGRDQMLPVWTSGNSCQWYSADKKPHQDNGCCWNVYQQGKIISFFSSSQTAVRGLLQNPQLISSKTCCWHSCWKGEVRGQSEQGLLTAINLTGSKFSNEKWWIWDRH
jgi:hypothetical protein